MTMSEIPKAWILLPRGFYAAYRLYVDDVYTTISRNAAIELELKGIPVGVSSTVGMPLPEITHIESKLSKKAMHLLQIKTPMKEPPKTWISTHVRNRYSLYVGTQHASISLKAAKELMSLGIPTRKALAVPLPEIKEFDSYLTLKAREMLKIPKPEPLSVNKVYVVEKEGAPRIYPSGALDTYATAQQVRVWRSVVPRSRRMAEKVVPYISVETLKNLPRSPKLDQIIREAERDL